ncbi:MAG: glycosyltransferase family 2 protein [Solirubrobacteraceae bacterium]
MSAEHSPNGPSMAVVVCTSSMQRAPLLRACIDSLLRGKRLPDELFVVVDTNPLLAEELAGSLPTSARLLECDGAGLSAARNVGIAASTSDVVAFVDDDATADERWLSALADAFAADPRLLGAGGPVLARWDAERRWMPDELLWVVGCTYAGHRDDAGPIRNPIGCNMAFRRRELEQTGGFETSFGKRQGALSTCDETELALRLQRAHGTGRIRFVPGAPVHHLVPASRVSWRLLLERSLSGGLAKGRLQRQFAGAPLATERGYVRLLVTRAGPRLLATGVRRRDRDSALGAVAIAACLTVTAAAYLVGIAREAHAGRRDATS